MWYVMVVVVMTSLRLADENSKHERKKTLVVGFPCIHININTDL